MTIFANLFKAMLVSAALLAAVPDALSQGLPRRDRSGSPREGQAPRDRASRETPSALSADPFSALERELPSLKVDLLLTAESLPAWNAFERDVRDIAELDRVRKRHLMALRDEGERPPTAVSFVAALVEEERQKSEATLDLKRHLESLYATLDARQKLMLDRRFVQSQAQPLGR